MTAWDIWEIIVNCMEIMLIYFFYTRALGKWKQNKWKTRIGAVCVLIYLSAINLSGLFNGKQTTVLSLVGYLSYVLLAYNGHIAQKIICGITPTIIIMIADFLTFTIATSFSSHNLDEHFDLGPVRFSVQLLYLIISAILYLVAILLNEKITRQKMFSYSSLFYIMFLLGLGIFVVNFLMEIALIAIENGLAESVNAYIIYIGITFIILFVSFMIYLWRWNSLKQDQHAMEMQLQRRKMMKEHYETTMQSVENMKKLKHDWLNHMRVTKSLIDSGKGEEASIYLADTYGILEKETNITNYTIDPMVNALLSEKREAALRKGIEIRYSIERVDKLPLASHDMCSLLGNLLDNATEACEREYDQNGLFIDLFLRISDHALQLIVKNKFSGRLHVFEGNLFSKKRASGHGMGLKIVREIAAQANGTFGYNVDEEDHIFEVSVMIPY